MKPSFRTSIAFFRKTTFTLGFRFRGILISPLPECIHAALLAINDSGGRTGAYASQRRARHGQKSTRLIVCRRRHVDRRLRVSFHGCVYRGSGHRSLRRGGGEGGAVLAWSDGGLRGT